MKLALLAALAGCDQLLGLGDIHAPAPTQQISGDYHFIVASVGSTGLPAVTEMPAPADSVIAPLLPDGTMLAIDRTADGSFTFATPIGSAYRLELQDSDESLPVEFQNALQTMALRRRVFARLDLVVATNPTEVSFFENVTAAPGDFSTISATGARCYLQLSDIANPAQDWSGSNCGLVSAAHYDQLFYEHWRETGTPAYYTAIEYDQQAVEMMDGVATTIGSMASPNTPTPLPQDRCVHLQTNRATELARLESITGVTTMSGASWEIYSTPSAEMGEGGLLALALDPGSPPTDDDREFVYGSPYAGEADVALAQIYVSRPLQLPTASTAYQLEDNENAFALVTPSSPAACATNVVTLDAEPIAMLASASLAGQVLASDGQAVTIDRSQPLAFDYVLSAGVSDYALVSLYEVTAENTATQLRPIGQYITAGPVELDPMLFARNHYYIFNVLVRRGFPGVAQLDFRTATFPSGFTSVYTLMFRIAS